MAIKILTKNAVDNTNIDGARANHFAAGMRSGIVKGALNEGTLFASASNVLALNTCELRISGHQVVIDEVEYKTFTNIPAANTRYALIAQIVVDENSDPTFSLIVQLATTALIQQNLFANETGSGTYQLELGRFTLEPEGTIIDIERTADLITGGIGGGEVSDIEFNASAYSLDMNAPPEANVDYNEETGKYDMAIGIPSSGITYRNESAAGTVALPYYTKAETNTLVSESRANPNLLINGDFQVNQRGLTTYTEIKKYTVDRWVQREHGTVEIVNGGIRVNCTETGQVGINQSLETFSKLFGKTLTLSMKVNAIIGSNWILRATSANNSYWHTHPIAEKTSISTIGIHSVTFDFDASSMSNYPLFNIGIFGNCSQGDYIEIEYIKLEVGSVATPLSPRPYAEELNLCQRYYMFHTQNLPAQCASSDTKLYPVLTTPSQLRVKPSLTVSGAGSYIFRGNGTKITSYTSVSVSTGNADMCSDKIDLEFTFPSNTLVENQAYSAHNDGGQCRISLDAEIY